MKIKDFYHDPVNQVMKSHSKTQLELLGITQFDFQHPHILIEFHRNQIMYTLVSKQDDFRCKNLTSVLIKV